MSRPIVHRNRFGFHSLKGVSRRRVLGGLGGGAAFLAGSTLPVTAWAKKEALVPEFPADVVLDWYDLILDLTRGTVGFSPPVASRAFAYLGIALYEALVPGMPGYRSLGSALPGLGNGPNAPTNLHFGLVANAVMAEMADRLFVTTSATNKAEIQALRQSYEALYGPAAGGHLNKSNKRGRDVAAHVFAWSTSDGGHQGYSTNFPTSYFPPEGEGQWVPTYPNQQRALQPFWGQNRAFTLPSNNAFDPGPHIPAFSSTVGSPFYDLAQEVYDAVNNATLEEQAIATFWSDDPGQTATPPGHSISIASQVIEQEGVPLDFAVEVFLKVGIAVADAFISCWDTKFRYNLIRPISYIRAHIDQNWVPYLQTPPFPEYTSGHSVQSGAMAEVLADLFGDDIAFTDRTHASRGLPARTFESFTEAADEAAISRLYGGIHYLPAIELGVTQGRQVGAQVNALPVR